MTTNAIARVEGSNLADRMHYAEALAVASLLPKAYQRQPGNVLLAMEFGDALGIRPIQAINDIHVIEGKPSASADLIASLVRRAGHRLRIWGDDKSATATIVRNDDPDYEFSATWTIERAQAAKLTNKTVWQSYPAAMLKARAVTEVARMGASEALHGIALYTPEELGAEVDDRGEMVARPVPAKRGGMAGLRDAVAAPKADEPVDADVVTDDGPAVVNMTTGEVKDPEPDLITKAQLTKLHILLNEAGMPDRESRLAYVIDTLDREVESSKDCTKAEATKVIERLTSEAQHPFPDEPREQT